jgi:CHASE1-domain containing sensor protein
MSTNSTGTANAIANATSTTGKVWTKVTSNKYTLLLSAGVILFVSMFITAFVQMSSVVGSQDSWNQIQPQITKIVILVMFGICGFIAASLAFYVQDPSKAVYFTIIVSGLAIGLSFIALSVAAISR